MDSDKTHTEREFSMLSDNLRMLRSRRELTQAEVAKKAGISVVAYRNLESGLSDPRPETLRRLAAALGVPLRELLAPTPPLEAVRFRAQKAMKRRGQVLSDVGRWLRNFNDLEALLSDHMPYRLEGHVAQLGTVTSEKHRAFQVAQSARHGFDLDDKEPIHDICGLFEFYGIKVYPLVLESEDFFGLSVAPRDGGPAIIVNVWDRISVERWIFTAAHELGHLLLHLDSYNVGETNEVPNQENEANLFASHFLMPDLAFQREWAESSGLPRLERVFKIKRIFRVSYRTVLYRLIESGIYTPELWREFQNEYRRCFGKTLLKGDEPEALAANSFIAAFPEAKRAQEPSELNRWDFVENRLRRLVREGVEKEKISLSRGAEILGIKLPQMREIAASWEG